MDSRADQESDYIKTSLKEGHKLKYFGGSVIPEMVLPKVKYVLSHAKEEERSRLRFFDLHDFIVFKLISTDKRHELTSIKPANDQIRVGIDGTIKGWSFTLWRNLVFII